MPMLRLFENFSKLPNRFFQLLLGAAWGVQGYSTIVVLRHLSLTVLGLFWCIILLQQERERQKKTQQQRNLVVVEHTDVCGVGKTSGHFFTR